MLGAAGSRHETSVFLLQRKGWYATRWPELKSVNVSGWPAGSRVPRAAEGDTNLGVVRDAIHNN